MLQSLSRLWGWLLPAAANHLWQSTVFALVAVLLTLLLRKNQARARYWLWLAASIKFLVPFALLMALGSSLAPPRAPTGTQIGYYYATEISQPFTQFNLPAVASSASSAQHLNFAELLPAAALLLWLAGFAAVLGGWFLRWRRIYAAVRQAAPVDEGREVEALRRLERASKIGRPIPLRLSQESLEPGVFGIFRPVLLWPEGISAHLSDAHLDAILAHELRHVRYRDNLAAAVHTLVQAIFWFHPLLWWMGKQMVLERERGCDEEVVGMGSRPGVYAEGILKACEFCIASPLASYSGVTGADLKKRIVQIMRGAAVCKLDLRKKLLLAAAGIAAIALPLALGRSSAAQSGTALAPAPPVQLAPVGSKFEVATIKPSKPSKPETQGYRGIGVVGRRFSTHETSVRDLISFAYGVQRQEIVAAPEWIFSQTYDILAEPEGEGQPSLQQWKTMVQNLLADRFHLKFHREQRELTVYALTVWKSAPKLTRSQSSSDTPNVAFSPRGLLSAHNVTMAEFAHQLQSTVLDRPVVDQTALPGRYDFRLKWTPDETQFAVISGYKPPSSESADAPPPDLFAAVREQLGLKLESQKAEMKVLVIDHVERPSPN